MAARETTYYALTRLREQSPEAKDWAVTDLNPEIVSLILRAFEQHAHTGIEGIKYPGYVAVDRYNYAPNPSAEVDTSLWSVMGTGAVDYGLSRSTNWSSSGTASFRIQGASTLANRVALAYIDPAHASMAAIATPGDIMSASANVNVVQLPNGTDAQVYLHLSFLDNSSAVVGTEYKSDPIRTTGTFTPTISGVAVPAGATRVLIGVALSAGTTAPTQTAGDVYFDSVLLTDGFTPGTYFDGSTLGASWSGAANASRSIYAGGAEGTAISPTLSVVSGGGVLSPGTTVAARLSYVNSMGLETAASQEIVTTIPPAASRALSPTLISKQAAVGALSGGTYIYCVTKRKGTGETPASDVLPVEIPYDQTYSVTVGFDPISSYTDGTTSLNIYRSTGLNSSFQLLATITNAGTTQFIDTNTVAPENVNVQPPTNNTFDANRRVRLDWTGFIHPANATKMRVFVTQQAGLWSTDHLLTEIDLAGTPATYVDYLGSETLAPGWPLNSSQIPSSPPKINLGTEAVGGLNLTADADFNGYKAIEMVLGNASLSTNGAVWYDDAAHKVKAFVNGSQVDLTPPVSRKNWVRNPNAETNASYWVTNGGAALTRTFSSPYSGSASISYFNASYGTNTIINLYSVANTTSAALSDAMPAHQGETGYIHVAARVRSSQALGATGTITLGVKQFSASGGTSSAIFGAETTNKITNPTAGTWYDLHFYIPFSSLTSTARFAGIEIKIVNNAGVSLVNYALDIDEAFVTKTSTTARPTYFDGNYVDAEWEGTANASFSRSGSFQHGLEEAGGHKALNITFANTNVDAILAKIANATTGSMRVLQPVTVAQGTTSGPVIVSDTFTLIPEMTVSAPVNFTTDGTRYFEVNFNCQVQLTIPTGFTTSTISIILEKDGSTVATTELTQEATVNNQHLIFTPTWHVTQGANPTVLRVLAMVTTGATATFLSTRRNLSAKVVI